MDNDLKVKIFRERFYGRQDVYGTEWKSSEGKKGFSPTCENFWKDGCHIKLKDGVNCSKCKLKVYIPVSNNTIIKHIMGKETQIHYLVHEDGNIKFGAIDFDYKPGRESEGYTFEDVKTVSELLDKWEIAHVIARSTNNGYHLYIFMDSMYPAYKFMSFIFYVYEKSGFLFQSQENIRPLPEMFPKQSGIGGAGGLGNGIKPPMVEPRFEAGRNCLVTKDNVVIPPDLQWEALDKVPYVSGTQMDNFLEDNEVHIIGKTGKDGKSSDSGSYSNGDRVGCEDPDTGSIEKAIEGCAAFRRIRDKAQSGQILGHDEGFALWHLAQNVRDGKDWFLRNVPGWGDKIKDIQQLEHSVKKGYAPWTCQTMQNKGVCLSGTKCFDKKPKVAVVNGHRVERDDLPESEWPEPSPTRYAYGMGDDFLKKLLSESEELVEVTDVEKRSLAVENIIKRSMVFDHKQQDILKDKIEDLKLTKKRALNKSFNKARADREEEFKQIHENRTDSIIVGRNIFTRRINPPAYAIVRQGKGDREIVETLGNFVIDITDSRTIIEIEDTGKISRRVEYKGVFKGRRNPSVDFEIASDIWNDNSDFYKFFGTVGKEDFNALRADVDVIRQVSIECAHREFEDKAPAKSSLYYGVQGWYDNDFIMKSVLVRKEGVEPNTEKPLDVSGKYHAANLDFLLIQEDELKSLLFHIKKDLFNAFPREVLFPTIGFSIMAPIHGYLNLLFRPTLWMWGDSGNGKTKLALMMQRFYGPNFSSGVNWRTTSQSMIDYGFQFKDCLLLADDFKAESPHQIMVCRNTVQNSYDQSIRGAMTRTGKQRDAKKARCLFIMTGEETPPNDTAFIARLLMIQFPLHDTSKTVTQYEECMSRSKSYSGIMPYFIHHVLQMDKKELEGKRRKMQRDLKRPIRAVQNSDRVSDNISLAAIGFELFIDFMEFHGVLSLGEVGELKKENWEYCELIRDTISQACIEQKNGNIFVDRLKELIRTGRAEIEGLGGYSRNDRCVNIGFVDKKDNGSQFAYLHPAAVIDLVKREMSTPLIISPSSASVQLGNMGIIDNNGKTIQRRFGGGRFRMWKVDLCKLELVDDPAKLRLIDPIDSEEDIADPINEKPDGLI